MNIKTTLIGFLFSPLISLGQKDLDTKIIATITDTSNIYEKVRLAFVNADFAVKPNGRTDTLSTYPMNTRTNGYLSAFASIENNTITIWAYLGYTHGNMFGETVIPKSKDYRKVFYYKNDKYWKRLMIVASLLGGTITYGK